MAKKFKSNFQDIFTPSSEFSEPTHNQQNKTSDTVRTTLLMDRNIYEKIKACAFYERKQVKEIINQSFTLKLKSYSDGELESMMDIYLESKKIK